MFLHAILRRQARPLITRSLIKGDRVFWYAPSAGLYLCLAVLLLLTTAVPVRSSLPDDAPPLPPPSAALSIINVSTAQELADACWNLASNQAIVIAPGTYDLASVTFPNGVDGRLTVGRFGAPPISNIQIRGATDDPTDVVLLGAGMLDPSVPFGFRSSLRRMC